MIQLELFISGQQVELFKDESISLTQSIQDIKDISKIFTDFTKTFNVPASKENNKIFKHFYNFNIVGFDARTKKEAELFLNYKPFKKGKIKFEGVTLKNNEPHTYRITFFGNIVNLKDTLGEDKLSNLDQLRLFDFDYNDANIIDYMTNGKDVDFFNGTIDDAIIFPLITHTARLVYDSNSSITNTETVKNVNRNAGTSSDYGVPLSELKPAIRLYAIIKAIENQAGYNLNFSDNFFSTTNLQFYNLYMWLHNKEGGLFVNQDAQYPVGSFGNIIGDVSDISGMTSKSFESVFNESNFRRELEVQVIPSGNAPYNLVVKKNGEELRRYDGLTGIKTNGSSIVSGASGIVGINVFNGSYTFFIETESTSTYNVFIRIKQERKGILKKRREILFNGSAAFAGVKKLNITSLIPDMKIIDFLTGLFKMFNLTAFQNSSGIVEVKTLKDFFADSTKIWDITKHLDKSQTSVDSVLPFKEINFKYKGTGSFLANNHKEIAATEWGSLDYKADEKFDGENYKIELPFEHFKYEHLYVTNDGVIGSNSNVQYGYSVDSKEAPYLGEPLIFYANKFVSTINVLKLDGSTTAAVTNSFMPFNTVSQLRILNTVGQTLNFNEEYDEFNRLPEATSLFKTYYEDYVKDMFDQRKRITNIKAYLPIEVIFNLNLADKIIVFDDMYRINKITTNFSTNLSTIELTNIFEEVTFKTLVAVQMNCTTADTTNYRADNVDLRASIGCSTDFTIPDNSSGIPNTIPDNNPDPVYDGIPLTVKPPVIADYLITVPTSTSVFFNHQITDFGKVGDTEKIAEYGFLYSNTKSDLEDAVSGVFDFETIKAKSGVSNVPFIPTSFFTVPKIVNYELTGLSDPATVYWRFYARTNTDPKYAIADASSTVRTVSTAASTQPQFGNANGLKVGNYVYPDDGETSFVSLERRTMNIYDAPDLNGVLAISISNPLNQFPVAKLIKAVEWFASIYNPIENTYYPVTQTFKYVDAQGSEGEFYVGNVSNAEVKWTLDYFGIPVLYIKGATSVTGTKANGGSMTLLSTKSWTGDIVATS
jgi:hypothetical protein